MHPPMKKIRYSVIIPTLNEEKFLPRLLHSLAVIKRKDVEVIVVDGHSKDQTVKLAKTFIPKLPGLQIIDSNPPGLPKQRNLGATRASGEWLLFIDADSVLLPYFFDRLDHFIRAKHPKLFTTWCRPDTEENGDAIVTLLANLLYEGAIRIKRPVAPGPLACVRRDVFTTVKGYDESLAWGEDYDFSNRIFALGIPMDMLRETLYVFSLRRFRHERKLKLVSTYTKVTFSILFTGKAPRSVPGYIMGGHWYGKPKSKPIPIKQFEQQIRQLVQDLFG